MKIFKAEPIESKLWNLRWTRSTHKKWVVVRAEDEDRAMTIASRDFGIATKKNPGADVLTSPWENNDLVVWSEINDPKYSMGGVEGVIDKG